MYIAPDSEWSLNNFEPKRNRHYLRYRSNRRISDSNWWVGLGVFEMFQGSFNDWQWLLITLGLSKKFEVVEIWMGW